MSRFVIYVRENAKSKWKLKYGPGRPKKLPALYTDGKFHLYGETVWFRDIDPENISDNVRWVVCEQIVNQITEGDIRVFDPYCYGEEAQMLICEILPIDEWGVLEVLIINADGTVAHKPYRRLVGNVMLRVGHHLTHRIDKETGKVVTR